MAQVQPTIVTVQCMLYYVGNVQMLCMKYEHIAILSLQAETELQKAVSTAAVGSQGLNKQMREFEKAKLTDLKVSVLQSTHLKFL